MISIICLIVITSNKKISRFLHIAFCKNRNIISFSDVINSYDTYVLIGLSKYWINYYASFKTMNTLIYYLPKPVNSCTYVCSYIPTM